MKKGMLAFVVIIAASLAVLVHREKNGAQMEDGIILYGNIDIRQVRLGFRVSGRLLESLVDEGDTVEPGMVIARLESTPFADELRTAQARFDAAAAALEKAVNGPRPAEIRQARANLEERRADMELAKLTYERNEQLLKKSAVSRETFDQASTALNAAISRFRASENTLQLLEEGTRPEEIKILEAELRAAEATASNKRTALSDTELCAPSRGVVITRVQEPGAIVASGEAVLVVSLDETLWARAYVPEPLLGHVYPGLEVDVHNDTNPGKAYRGVVGFVSPSAEFTPKSVETPELRTDLVYRLRIVISEPDNGLRQGMPVTVRVPLLAMAAR